MERKTKIHAEDDKQEIFITREFDLPLELLFRAHAEAGLIEAWMGTKVLTLESRKHGSWRYETSNPQGIVVFSANGVIHDFVPNQKIIRTFEMENSSLPPQIEFLEFSAIDDERSLLKIQIIYKSVEIRDQALKLPFAYGLNMAHNRLQEVVAVLKTH